MILLSKTSRVDARQTKKKKNVYIYIYNLYSRLTFLTKMPLRQEDIKGFLKPQRVVSDKK